MANPFPPVELLGKSESFGLFPRTAPIGITGLTGGGLTNLDGIDVANMPVGTRISLVFGGVSYNYTLTTSVTAESSPACVAPDSGNSNVRWILDTPYIGFGLFADGSVAVPSISFFNDDATGFYRPTTGVMTFVSNGTASLRFDTSGTIGAGNGIGNSVALQASGAIALTAAGTNQNITLTSSGNGVIILAGGSTPTIQSASGIVLNATAGHLYLRSAAGSFLINDVGDGLLLGTATNSANGRLQLATHTTSAGGIGFGTDAQIFRIATAQLKLAGTTTASVGFSVDGPNSGTNAGAFLYVQNNASTLIAIGNYSAVVGGAYSARPLLYGNDVIWTNRGFLSYNSTEGVGYTNGAGGAQTQATNKATTVVSNTITTAITMNAAALNADTTVSFTFTNSSIAATDTVIVTHQSAGTSGAYLLNAFPAAGSATISVRNITAGPLSEAIVLRVTVIKSVSV